MEGGGEWDVARGTIADVALTQLMLAHIAGCGDETRGYVTAAAEAWLRPECLASHRNGM